MIYLILPRGHNYGWGVCGKYLVREISQITEVKYITEKFTINDIGDELDFYFLKSKLIEDSELLKITAGAIKHVDYPILQSIANNTLLHEPRQVKLKGAFKAGYTFF